MLIRAKSYSVNVSKRHRFFPSWRFLVLCLLFLGATAVNMNYSILNFALTCMVNATYLEDPTAGNATGSSSCAVSADSAKSDSPMYHGSYLWDRTIQSNLLTAEAWGAVWFLIPAGWLLDKYGAKWLYAAAMLLLGFSGMVIPIAADMGGWKWTFACRVLQGVGMEIAWPAIFTTTTRWFPVSELGIVSGIAFSGFSVGTVVAFAATGYLCTSSLGWKGAFYCSGGLTVLLGLVWIVLYRDIISEAPGISRAEVAHIRRHRNINDHSETRGNIPLAKILSSPAVWAVVGMSFSTFYTIYFIGDYGPTYMKEILDFRSGYSGILMALPYIAQVISRLPSGLLSDIMAKHISMTLTVKAFTAISGFGMAGCLAGMTLFDFEHRVGAIAFMVLTYFFCGFSLGGFFKSICVIAPQFSGTISGISTTASYLSGIIGPYIAGALTPDGTPQQWRSTFYVATAVCVVGTTFFLVLGSGERQPWACPDNVKNEKRMSTILGECAFQVAAPRRESVTALVAGSIVHENVLIE